MGNQYIEIQVYMWLYFNFIFIILRNLINNIFLCKILQRDFYWDAHHDVTIRRNFSRKGATRMRDQFTDIRKSGKRPPWIGEDIWVELCRKWSTPEYVEKRERAKKNRLSDSEGLGTCLHTCGVIPSTEHMRRMVRFVFSYIDRSFVPDREISLVPSVPSVPSV